jgi:hypothetical protein
VVVEEQALERDLVLGVGPVAVGNVLKLLRRRAQMKERGRYLGIRILEKLAWDRKGSATGAGCQKRGRIGCPVGLLCIRKRRQAIAAGVENDPIPVAGKVELAGNVKLHGHVAGKRASRSQAGRIRRDLSTAGRNDERRYQH